MQSTGIVRKLDSLGRITLPMELRKSFDIGEREPLEIFTEEDKIIIKKYNPSDIFTGQCEDLIEYRGKKVSRDSIRELARIADRRVIFTRTAYIYCKFFVYTKDKVP